MTDNDKEMEALTTLLEFADARIDKLVSELKEERLIVEAMQEYVNAVDDYEIAIIDALDKRVIN
tara:strand:- start:733 stop:924 length:192 start_codon:yes stop_codon:yes gene_type:complete